MLKLECFYSELLKKLTESNGEAKAPGSDSESKSSEEAVRKRKGSDRQAQENQENASADHTPEQLAAVKR